MSSRETLFLRTCLDLSRIVCLESDAAHFMTGSGFVLIRALNVWVPISWSLSSMRSYVPLLSLGRGSRHSSALLFQIRRYSERKNLKQEYDGLVSEVL